MAMFSGLHVEPVYNTRAVVNRTGVPADTVRAWERRYQLPSPCRSNGNQRLYSERDVAIIVWLRDQTRDGLTISHAVALFRSLDVSPEDHPRTNQSNVSAIEQQQVVWPEIPETARPSFFELCNNLIDALGQFNGAAAERLVSELTEIEPVESICHEVLRPSMSEIRRRRRAGTLPVSVERFAQAFMHRKISSLFNLSHPEEGDGPIVAAGVEGDYDEIELLVLALFLSRNGFSVIYLGSDIAASELRAAIEALHPQLVILNVSSEMAAPSLEEALELLAPDAVADDAPVIGVAGGLFERLPDLQHSVKATYMGSNGFSAVANCSRLIGAMSQQAAIGR